MHKLFRPHLTEQQRNDIYGIAWYLILIAYCAFAVWLYLHASSLPR